jgi:hypothetical protein
MSQGRVFAARNGAQGTQGVRGRFLAHLSPIT